MKTKDDSSDLIDAYRLSGQAVAFLVNNKAIRHVTIQGKGGKRSRCNVTRCQRQNITDLDHKRSLLEIEIVAGFCGQIAVAAFSHTEKPAFDVNAVDRGVYDVARQATGSDIECDLMLAWLYERAMNVFENDGVSYAIGVISTELVKTRTVSGTRAKELYDNAIQVAKY